MDRKESKGNKKMTIVGEKYRKMNLRKMREACIYFAMVQRHGKATDMT